jgi:hypothetical protein
MLDVNHGCKYKPATVLRSNGSFLSPTTLPQCQIDHHSRTHIVVSERKVVFEETSPHTQFLLVSRELQFPSNLLLQTTHCI